MTITEKYAVKSQNRLYDGIALFATRWSILPLLFYGLKNSYPRKYLLLMKKNLLMRVYLVRTNYPHTPLQQTLPLPRHSPLLFLLWRRLITSNSKAVLKNTLKNI